MKKNVATIQNHRKQTARECRFRLFGVKKIQKLETKNPDQDSILQKKENFAYAGTNQSTILKFKTGVAETHVIVRRRTKNRKKSISSKSQLKIIHPKRMANSAFWIHESR